MPPLCLTLLGPTASGKSALAMELAIKLNGEIIALDSTTVYRGMNIGTDKPTSESMEKVKHHLLDLLDPNEPFSAFHFVQKSSGVISEILSRKKLPIVVGGSYFYLRALQHGLFPVKVVPAEVIEDIEREYFEEEVLNTKLMHQHLKEKDPKGAEKIHPNDKYRLLRALAIIRSHGELPSEMTPVAPEGDLGTLIWMKYAMAISRHQLNQNIVHRTETMIRGGLVEETKQIMERFPGARALQIIGYSEALRFLNNKLTEKQLRNEIIERTRQLAKRQVCWLRSDPEIRYIDSRDVERMVLEVENLKFALGTES